MEQAVIKDKKGLTLIEVMISLVVLLIVFLGMMQTIALSVNLNVKNSLRDEAVRIAHERMVALKNTPFDNLLADTGGAYIPDDVDPFTAGIQSTVTRSFRSFDIVFTSDIMAEDISAEDRRIYIRISWAWKTENFSHETERVFVRESGS